MQGELKRIRLDSKCLADNPLGDPADRELYVYLPPGYDGKRRFPIVMLLAGYGSTNHSIVSWNPWKPNTVELFDRLVVNGQSAPALLVLPDCVNRWAGSQFLDSAASGRYQTYLADEVIEFVDREFATIPKREARAVAGRSSGGFGALRLGMDRPETVSVIGSHAGDAAFEISMRPMFNAAAIAISAAGGLAEFAQRIPEGGPRSATEFDAIFMLAAAAAYAPDPRGPFPHAQLPFSLETGETEDEIWSQWCAHDPLVRLSKGANSLRKMALVYLDAGSRDEHGLHFATRLLKGRLEDEGVNLHHEEYDGGHRGTSWRYETSLPLMIQALETA